MSHLNMYLTWRAKRLLQILSLFGGGVKSGGHEDFGRSEIVGLGSEVVRRERQHRIQTQSHRFFLSLSLSLELSAFVILREVLITRVGFKLCDVRL